MVVSLDWFTDFNVTPPPVFTGGGGGAGAGGGGGGGGPAVADGKVGSSVGFGPGAGGGGGGGGPSVEVGTVDVSAAGACDDVTDDVDDICGEATGFFWFAKIQKLY